MPDDDKLNICLACSELTPLVKTGGLADVTAALFHWFESAGQDIRAIVPFYSGLDTSGMQIDSLPGLQDCEMTLGERSFSYRVLKIRSKRSGPGIYLLQCPELYGGNEIYSGPDEHLRFILLSRAAIELCQRQQFAPDIFHCSDWHTALIPLFLKSVYGWDQMFSETRSVLTIHNIGYQGVFGAEILPVLDLNEAEGQLDQEDLGQGRINFLKTGIMHADLLTTVSPTYAREIFESEYGMGLENHLRARQGSVVGILNGVDYEEWNPSDDPHIPFPYSAKNLSGKEENKQALLKEMGLEYRFDRPLLGMVTRLTYQKGIDLVREVIPDFLGASNVSLVVLGNGDHEYEQFFHWLHSEFPGRVAFFQGFNNELAHRIEAGSDFFLMPSRYEPCGLNQMYSLRYGTVPIVRATGGLTDSVQHFDPLDGSGTGIVFHDYDANGLEWALKTALGFYRNKRSWKQLVFNGMAKNYSWDEQGRLYEEKFRKLLS